MTIAGNGNHNGDPVGDFVDNTGGKALELVGSAAFLAMSGAFVVGDAGRQAKEAVITGARLSEEVAILGAHRALDVTLGAAKRILGRTEEASYSPMVDGIVVPSDQVERLAALKREDRPMALNTISGGLAFLVMRQVRDMGGTPKAAQARFKKLTERQDGVNAKLLATLPDTSLSLDPKRQ